MVASEDSGKVEAEAVDMIIGYPVAQTFYNHIAHIGVITVQRITATAKVVVTAIGHEHVIGLVVDAAIGDIRALFVTLGCMVEYHVEHYLDTVGVEFLYQILQLVGLHAEST